MGWVDEWLYEAGGSGGGGGFDLRMDGRVGRGWAWLGWDEMIAGVTTVLFTTPHPSCPDSFKFGLPHAPQAINRRHHCLHLFPSSTSLVYSSGSEPPPSGASSTDSGRGGGVGGFIPAEPSTSTNSPPASSRAPMGAGWGGVEEGVGGGESIIDHIPGSLNDRRSPLGELYWVLTAICDAIAWDLLPTPLFSRLYRQGLSKHSEQNYVLHDFTFRVR